MKLRQVFKNILFLCQKLLCTLYQTADFLIKSFFVFQVQTFQLEKFVFLLKYDEIKSNINIHKLCQPSLLHNGISVYGRNKTGVLCWILLIFLRRNQRIMQESRVILLVFGSLSDEPTFGVVNGVYIVDFDWMHYFLKLMPSCSCQFVVKQLKLYIGWNLNVFILYILKVGSLLNNFSVK